MTQQKLIASIEQYQPYNVQEEMDKSLILEWIKNNNNAFLRENTVAHMTASAWVVNNARSKVLMVYHNIYNSWSWLGGHEYLSVPIQCHAVLQSLPGPFFHGSSTGSTLYHAYFHLEIQDFLMPVSTKLWCPFLFLSNHSHKE